MLDIPERLPIEDLEHGLYIHEKDRLITIETAEGTTYAVPAELFMEVQRDRDGWRRCSELVNEALCRGDIKAAAKRFEAQGLTGDNARAMSGILAWVRDQGR